MKFCYGTNLGSFIMPSLKNCYIIGKSNTYIISILNHYIMYKDYYTYEDIIDFNISFKTINNGQNITFTPNFDKYSINKRILEGYPNTIEITNNEERTLLTKLSNNEKYLFIRMEICTPDTSVEYEFYNTIYNSKLGETGKIEANSKKNFKNIENTYLDIYLVLKKMK